MTLSRYLARAAIACVVFATPAAFAGQLDLDNPDDAFTVARKTQCSTIDGEQVTWW